MRMTTFSEIKANDTGDNALPPSWSIDDAADLYGISRWGQDYFHINKQGHVSVHPTADPELGIDLKQLVDELRERDIQTPVLIRFNDLIRHRAEQLHATFQHAIDEFSYKNRYACVYPIKVNQQRHVVEEILKAGKPLGFGLEAGSKPELLAVMAMVKDDQTPIICNGFKDDKFIEAVILAAKIGKNITPVVEKFNELKQIIKYAERHDVRPSIGLRVKLSARGAGRWEQSGGDRSKFGLFFSELVAAVKYLKQHKMLDCLTLLHFHLGSQINNIRNIKGAIIELARVYVELQKLGAGLKANRCRRRARRGLRRLQKRGRSQHQLLAAGIRQRHRVPRARSLRSGGRRAPHDHQRIRPGTGDLQQRAGVQRDRFKRPSIGSKCPVKCRRKHVRRRRRRF